MVDINYFAVVVAAIVAFLGSFGWYILLGNELAKVSPAFAAQQPAAWKMLAVFAGSLVLAFVVAYVLALIGNINWTGAVGIGFLLWVGLSAMQWLSSIVWENVPLKMAAIHAGDWLLKLIIISTIVCAWR